ncbi:MAG: hypothetical protein KFF77_05815 [Bacteroidetes bacterium]|nr:hypothetical protein [Bacteroidota bacterium]
MPSSIQFLRDPRYTDTVIMFILAPAGVNYSIPELGKNLFGNERWDQEHLIIDGLSPKPVFRYTDISLHWTDFLDLAFRHIDHALFYVPHKDTFKEIRKESLLPQNPDLYSFSFFRFSCEARKGLVLPPQQEEPVLRPIIPSAPKAKPARPAATVPAVATRQSVSPDSRAALGIDSTTSGNGEEALVDANLVSIDAEKLAQLFDRLGTLYDDGIKELRSIRSLLNHRS